MSQPDRLNVRSDVQPENAYDKSVTLETFHDERSSEVSEEQPEKMRESDLTLARFQ